jgi:hypothetical protein
MLGHGLPFLSRAVSPQARIRCVMAQASSSLGGSTVVSAYARQPRLLEELGSTFKLVCTVEQQQAPVGAHLPQQPAGAWTGG